MILRRGHRLVEGFLHTFVRDGNRLWSRAGNRVQRAMGGQESSPHSHCRGNLWTSVEGRTWVDRKEKAHSLVFT